ncbi:hypothetical protein AgCh_021848 [Apium graveolens]
MNDLRVEIHHGGEFKNKEGIYYYKGGKIDTLYDVDLSILTVDSCLDYLQEAGYGKGLKLYYKKHGSHDRDGYKLLWNDESFNEIRKDAKKVSMIEIFVDHYAEEKVTNIMEYISFVDDDMESDDPDYHDEEDYKEIREIKRKLKEGLIDPLREGNLTDLNISNSATNITVELGNDRDDHIERDEVMTETRTKRKYDSILMGEVPQWTKFVQHGREMLGTGYDDNQELGYDRVEKNVEEIDDSDSFDAPSIQSSDSSDNEEVHNLEMIKKKNKKKKKKKNVPHYPTFNPKTPMDLIEFEPGLIFTSREYLKEAIRNYGVAKQRRVYLKRCDLKRMQVKCRDEYKWELWASRMTNDEAFQIKTYKKEHNSIIVSKQRMVKADWLAKQFGNIIRSNPRWKLKEYAAAITAKYNILCTLNQCWWAKKAAMAELESMLKEDYARLWDYGDEVLRTNPGSSLFIKGGATEESENPTFQRLYIYFNALKMGFLSGCRKVIGLDGCFLKGYVKGELLTAIGRDANNQMFPIAWAVVEVECTYSWVWFIKLLKEDLYLGDGYAYTVITYQQKGLKNAIDDYLPAAEHTCCARHIHANWKKNHPGNALKNALWRAAKVLTVAEFNLVMDEIRSISPFAYDDLLKTNPKYWSRAYFSTFTRCDVMDNNISECFNSWILEARYKPIISMLDHIRVKDLDGNQFEVDMKLRTCSCRKWKLSGIPCIHGCQAILSINAQPEDYIDECFKKKTYLKAYPTLMCPMKGSREWPNAAQVKLLPPKARRMPGRPKKHRRREAYEVGSGSKLSKKGIVMKCSRCLMIGHNKATCKTSEADVAENLRKADEAKKAQAEAAKAHSLRNKQNVRKKSTQSVAAQTSTMVGKAKKRDSWSDQIRGRIRPMCALDPVRRAELCAMLGTTIMTDPDFPALSNRLELSIRGSSSSLRVNLYLVPPSVLKIGTNSVIYDETLCRNDEESGGTPPNHVLYAIRCFIVQLFFARAFQIKVNVLYTKRAKSHLPLMHGKETRAYGENCKSLALVRDALRVKGIYFNKEYVSDNENLRLS